MIDLQKELTTPGTAVRMLSYSEDYWTKNPDEAWYGSPDKALELCKRFAIQSPVIRFLSGDYRGVCTITRDW